MRNDIVFLFFLCIVQLHGHSLRGGDLTSITLPRHWRRKVTNSTLFKQVRNFSFWRSSYERYLESKRKKINSLSTDFSNDTINVHPILVFVNKKSGGKQGISLIKSLRSVLPVEQVCDLNDQDPVEFLTLYSEYADRLKVLCCGGDGTVGWIVGALRIANMSQVPIGVIPLGTGNDFVRTLESMHQPGSDRRAIAPEDISTNTNISLLSFVFPQIREIDTWTLTVTPHRSALERDNGPNPQGQKRRLWGVPLRSSNSGIGNQNSSDKETTAREFQARSNHTDSDRQVMTRSRRFVQTYRRLHSLAKQKQTPPPTRLMVNYFSVGVDGVVTMAFHELRRARPGLFLSPLVNKVWYGLLGLWVLLFSRRLHLSAPSAGKRALDLLCDGIAVPIPAGVESVVVLNGDSFAGGVRLWGREESKEERVPSASDGLLEVVGLHGLLHLGSIRTGMSTGIKLAQCRRVEIVSRRSLPVQMDGEPWTQPPARIVLEESANRTRIMIPQALTNTSVTST